MPFPGATFHIKAFMFNPGGAGEGSKDRENRIKIMLTN